MSASICALNFAWIYTHMTILHLCTISIHLSRDTAEIWVLYNVSVEHTGMCSLSLTQCFERGTGLGSSSVQPRRTRCSCLNNGFGQQCNRSFLYVHIHIWLSRVPWRCDTSGDPENRSDCCPHGDAMELCRVPRLAPYQIDQLGLQLSSSFFVLNFHARN